MSVVVEASYARTVVAGETIAVIQQRQGVTQCVAGRSRNSSTAMPSSPTSNVRAFGKARTKTARPGNESRDRPLLTSMAVTYLPAFTTKSTS